MRHYICKYLDAESLKTAKRLASDFKDENDVIELLAGYLQVLIYNAVNEEKFDCGLKRILQDAIPQGTDSDVIAIEYLQRVKDEGKINVRYSGSIVNVCNKESNMTRDESCCAKDG